MYITEKEKRNSQQRIHKRDKMQNREIETEKNKT